jgi:hypothetical protein
MEGFQSLSEIDRYLAHDLDADVIEVEGVESGRRVELGAEEGVGLLFVK